MRCLWAAGVFACVWLGTAQAAPADPAAPVDLDAALSACVSGEEPDAVIAGCTAAMERKDVSTEGRGILYERRGAAAYRKGDFSAAITDYAEAVRINPKSAGAYGGRGIAFYSVQEYAQAIYDLTRALELDPQHPFAHSIRGICYVAIGQQKEAVEDLTASISAPGGGTAMDYYYRGAAWAGLGDKGKAKADFNQCLAKAPGQKACKDAFSQLK